MILGYLSQQFLEQINPCPLYEGPQWMRSEKCFYTVCVKQQLNSQLYHFMVK